MFAATSNSFRAVFLRALMLGSLSIAAPALAEDENVESDITVEGSATFITDYRYRGISYSNLDPAVQAGISVSTAPGFYISGWGSSIAEYAGSSFEFDLAAGWAGNIAGLDTDVGVVGYFYPGSQGGTSIYELYASVSVPLGPVSGTLGVNWSPDQSNLDRGNRYFYGMLEAGIPETPITLKASLGHERGSLVYDEAYGKTTKMDWLIGADINWNALTLGVAYVGTNLSNDRFEGWRANELAKDGVVVSLTASF